MINCRWHIFRIIFILLFIGGTAYSQAPIANFGASQTTACNPAVISFTDLSTGGPTSWSWNFGNGNTSTLQNPSTSYLTPGTYTVTLTVTNGSGSNTKTVVGYIVINASPVVSFTMSDSEVCPGSNIYFTSNVQFNSAGNGTYIWNLNGSTFSTTNASYTYTTNGTYLATLYVSNSIGCNSSYSHNVTVYQKPVTTVTANPQHICQAGGSTIFTASSAGTGLYTYVWDFGDGSTGAGPSATHSYTTTGTYNISLITTDGHGCKDTLNLSNYITVSQASASFSGTTSICDGQPATFASTSGTVTSLIWDFGDGSSSSISPAYHTYAAAGTYNVKLKVSVGGCIDSVVHAISIWPKPNVSFIDTPFPACPPPVAIQFNNSTTGATNYTWTFGDGNTSTSISPSHTYMSNGVYHISLVATSIHGCVDSMSKNDTVYSGFVTLLENPAGGCIPFNVNFSYGVWATLYTNTSVYPYPVVSHTWNFGDGTSSTAANPSHTYSIYGKYPITLTVTTANGCTFIKTDTVRAGTPPIANFTALPDTVCIRTPVTFTNLSSSNSTDWLWDFGDGGYGADKDPVHSYTHAGVFSVKLIAFNNGCPDSTTKTNYIVVKDPESKFSYTFSCDTPLKVSFANLSTNYTSFVWYFGDGTTSTATNPIHMYGSLGNYYVSLVTHNTTTGCSDSMTQGIHLVQLVPDFTVDDTGICLGTPSTFVSSVTGGLVYRYYWEMDGIPIVDSTPNVTFTFGTPGYHSIKLGVKDEHGCIRYITKTNYVVVGHPTASWSAPAGCAPANITFTDNSNYPTGTYSTVRHWYFGDGTNATTTSSGISHAYSNAGTYVIGLVVTDNVGCIDSSGAQGSLLIDKVIADFSVSNTTICQGVPVFFQNLTQGNNLQYQWDFGDGTTSSSLSPLHTYSGAGTYTVKLKAVDNIGCQDSIVKTTYIQVQANPHAAFTISDTFSICPPLVVTTTNTSTGGTQYAWTFGNGGSSTLFTPAITYAASGIYDVVLVVSNAAGCKDTARGRVRILGYAGSLSYSPLSGCAPLTVTFNALNVSMVPGMVFDFADGSTTATTISTTSHIYTQPGIYVPKLLMTDNNGCSSSSIGLDTIKVDGINSGFTFSPYPACVSGTLTFIDTSKGLYSAIVSHLWLFHDGTTGSGLNTTHNYTGPGTYPVTLITTTSAGCRDTLNSSVTFWNLPVIDAGADTTICLSDSARLSPLGGVLYQWTADPTLSCNLCANPLASPTVQTQYVVIGTDMHGCKNMDSVTVSIKTKTDGVAGAGGEVCQGIPVQLSASGGTSYLWSPSTGLSNGHNSQPVATPQVTTRYMVITKLAGCIADTDYVDVTIHPLPIVDAGPSQTIIAGNTAQLQATGSTFITQWAWAPDEPLSCATCALTDATPKHTTTFTIVATTDFNCTSSDTVTVFVVCDNSQVFVPNTFTPNGNGYNDRFYVHGKGLQVIRSFRIYDRWGELIFERQNINVNDEGQAWDGTLKGVALPPDVYVYTVDAVCDTGEPVNWKGDVMLMR